MITSRHVLLSTLAALMLVAGCSSKLKKEAEYPEDPETIRKKRGGSMISEDGGFTLFGGSDKGDAANAAGAGGIPVNSFLWRGALDSLSFMPLLSTDPFGGVITTDWYQPSEDAVERFKLNVLILSATLRADGVRVSVFRQERTAGGQWKDAAPNPKVAREFEDLILNRARELRVAAGK